MTAPDNHAHPAPAAPAGAGRRFVPPVTTGWPAHWQIPTTADLADLEAGHRHGLVPAHTPVLHRPAPPLLGGPADATHIAESLYQTVRRLARDGGGRTAGLAAPQIGLTARAFLFDPRTELSPDELPVEQLRCIINPIVEPAGHDLASEVEGCTSTGPIKGWVLRATRVRLRGNTPDGKPVDELHTGWAARILQHEADHLDGILFPNRISDDHDLLWASTEQLDQFIEYVREHRRGEAPSWNIRTPRDQWDAILEGLPVLGNLADSTNRPEDG